MMAFEIITAFVLDIIFGDPYWFPHPVKLLGKAIECLENALRSLHLNLYFAGFILLILITGASFAVTYTLVTFSHSINPWLAFIISSFFIYTSLSVKCLGKEGMKIYNLLKTDDLQKARKQLSMIVGRDTQNLGESEIIKATVETMAENMVDGVISPLFFACIGGAPLAIVFKAVSTLDSMVGYKNEKYKEFGFFSAKTDDIANWIPARLSAVIIPVAASLLRMSFMGSIKSIIRDGRKSPSPNSGIAESGFAGAIGIQLGGTCFYNGIKYEKPLIGNQHRISKRKDILISIRLMYLVSILFAALAAGLLLVLEYRSIFLGGINFLIEN